MSSESPDQMLDPVCYELSDSISNADMDGIAVAVASESRPTAGIYFLDLNNYLGR